MNAPTGQNNSAPVFLPLAKPETGEEQRGLLFVNGYLTNEADCSPWVQSFRELGWRGGVYKLAWDTGGQYGEHLLKTGIASVVAGEALFRVASWIFPPLGAVAALRWLSRGAAVAATATSMGTEHWKEASARADAAGRELGRYLLRMRPRWAAGEFRLAGFSLGARVIHRALQTLGQRKRAAVDSVDVYGGALLTSEDWRTAASAVRGSIRNYHSHQDGVLKGSFATAENGEAIGLVGIKASERIRNIDLTANVASHSDYKARIGPLKQCRFQPLSARLGRAGGRRTPRRRRGIK